METALSTSNPASFEVAQSAGQTRAQFVFEKLTLQMGAAKIARLWTNVDQQAVVAEWDKGLASMERQEIARGLTACRTREFAPNLGEFLRLCRPALDPETAWFEAQSCLMQRDNGEVGDWSHPAVYRAAREMGIEVRGGDFKVHRKRWEFLLEREFRKGVLMGIPRPAIAIGHGPVATRPPNSAERAALAALRQRCKGGMNVGAQA